MRHPAARGKRHLSVVPDLPADAEFDDTPAPVDPAPTDWSPVTADAELPPGLSAEDLRRSLAHSGAPEQFLHHAATFGDDAAALFEWLRLYGPVFSEKQWAADLLDHWSPLLLPGTSAVDAEKFCGTFLATFHSDEPDGLQQVLEEAVRSERPEALAMARALAAIGPKPVRAAAVSAAERLAGSGLTDMPWVAALGTGQLVEAKATPAVNARLPVLTLTFRVAGDLVTFGLQFDASKGNGIQDCWLGTDLRSRGLRKVSKVAAGRMLSPALAAPICPTDADQVERLRSVLPLVRVREQLVLTPGAVVALPSPAGAAIGSVHRLKVTLAETKPAIWRRLEVNSSLSLADLHLVVLAAFGWSNSHLWEFETPDGEFGELDPEIEIRDARGQTVAAAAPRVGDRVTYLYDFGDNWKHQIAVETIGAATPGARYPRCTAGRRAAPPENCGGVDGYRRVQEIMADPSDPRYEDAMTELGLESAAEFDPAAFDVDEVNEALALIPGGFRKP